MPEFTSKSILGYSPEVERVAESLRNWNVSFIEARGWAQKWLKVEFETEIVFLLFGFFHKRIISERRGKIHGNPSLSFDSNKDKKAFIAIELLSTVLLFT